MKSRDYIIIQGARQHNLKNINLEIPKFTFTVITGVSGSGKSTLAFDVLYAEGYRRYVESLSSYAKQFLGLLEKPEVDKIEGLSPVIAIEQKTISKNPRSTVGTVTEIYDHLRLLFAKVGVPYCPNCNIELSPMTINEIINLAFEKYKDKKIYILSPIVLNRKGEHKELLEKFLKKGFLRVKIDGKEYYLEEALKLPLNKYQTHTIELIIDRLKLKEDNRQRFISSLELALEFSKGYVEIEDYETKKIEFFSTRNSCPKCGFTFKEISPRLFSFNLPLGACPTCLGTGDIQVEKYKYVPCPTCKGNRLNKEALSVKLDGKDIIQFTQMDILSLYKYFKNSLKDPLKVIKDKAKVEVYKKIVKEILERLEFLIEVGAEYLSLDRKVKTLSGGEAQRIRLATQIASKLSGVLYILDEPSIGLHAKDNDKLISILKKLRNYGNTVIVVEHDLDTIKAADFIIDMGPGSGIHGGEVVATGSPKEIENNDKSLTGKYLSKKLKIEVPKKRRPQEKFLKVYGASKYNIVNENFKIPLKNFVCITGISGSGKSTFVFDILLPTLEALLKEKELFKRKYKNEYKKVLEDNLPKLIEKYKLPIKDIKGIENIDKVIWVDQSPPGKSSRSVPATYIGIWDYIRDIFASLPESQARGYTKSYFSFNVPGGRCEKCKGEGLIEIEMLFMPDMKVLCDECQGKRFRPD
ncbi:MAG TPA: ABC-ATPase UvrA, partial [Desulfurobacteriaceae bacterium]|nr:ABC-ATPase UvrA [Desulfurobacteriaceae bacterium]